MDIRANTFAPMSSADSWVAVTRQQARAGQKSAGSDVSPAQQVALDETRRIDRGIGNVGRVRLPPAADAVNARTPVTLTYAANGKLSPSVVQSASPRTAEPVAQAAQPTMGPTSGVKAGESPVTVSRTEMPRSIDGTRNPQASPAVAGSPDQLSGPRANESTLVSTLADAPTRDSPLNEKPAAPGELNATQKREVAQAQAERTGEAQNTEAPGPSANRVEMMRQRLMEAYLAVPVATMATLSLRA